MIGAVTYQEYLMRDHKNLVAGFAPGMARAYEISLSGQELAHIPLLVIKVIEPKGQQGFREAYIDGAILNLPKKRGERRAIFKLK